jgi:hypothetical protein
MNTNPDSERDDILLDAVLGDEDWQAANAACKRQALQAFRARQRFRASVRWAGSTLVLAGIVACAAFWARHPAKSPPQTAAISQPRETNAPPAAPPAHYLTDAQLLASFPKGSCFIAEVDGQKQLVFLDPKLERTYIAQPAVKLPDQ